MTTMLQSSSTSNVFTPIKLTNNKPNIQNIITSTSTSSSSSSSHNASTSAASSNTNLSLCKHLVNSLNKPNNSLENHLKIGTKWSLELNDQTINSNIMKDITMTNGKKRRKITQPECSQCSISLARPMLCLDCGIVFCGTSEGRNHAKSHSVTTGHILVYDLRSSSMYCESCDDYVYHPTLDQLQLIETIKFDEEKSSFVSGAKRIHLDSPSPSPSTSISISSPSLDSIIPRGLRNLGNSCYMSVILQSFLHNPLLRSYFLSDRHNRDLCPISNPTTSFSGSGNGSGSSSNGAAGGKGEEGDKPCLSCEMDRLFSECYTSDSTPFGPINFLHSMWQSSSELSGYAQQDAHEFLISSLNLLHSSTPNHSNSSILCKCIVHTTFSGQLRSEVQCGKCSNVTKSEDPFLDLSLDLRGAGTGVGKNYIPAVTLGGSTLRGCLSRFTSRESLPAKGYTCTACGDSTQVASKQLSIKKLPPVLCIQLKRFEHGNGAQKIDTAVKFPLNLNMRPYTSLALGRGIGEEGASSTEFTGDDSMFEYELFSVINHEGLTISNGHYTNYCRSQDDFYCFDDEKVKRSPLSAVLGSQSYLLSYVKKTLVFKSSTAS